MLIVYPTSLFLITRTQDVIDEYDLKIYEITKSKPKNYNDDEIILKTLMIVFLLPLIVPFQIYVLIDKIKEFKKLKKDSTCS